MMRRSSMHLVKGLTRSAAAAPTTSAAISTASSSSSSSSPSPPRVLVISMVPNGGALTPALRELGYHPYTFQDCFRRGRIRTHPQKWIAILQRRCPFDLSILAGDDAPDTSSSSSSSSPSSSPSPRPHFDALVGPPASLAFESILATCPLSTRVVLCIEEEKVLWEKEMELILAQHAKLAATSPWRRAAGDLHAMIGTMMDLRRFNAFSTSRVLQMQQLSLAASLDLFETRVVERVPRDRLLIFTKKDGWAELCSFLGCTPPTTDFPSHANNSSAEVFALLAESQQHSSMALIFFLTASMALLVVLLLPFQATLRALVGDIYERTQEKFRVYTADTREHPETFSLRTTFILAKKATLECEEEYRASGGTLGAAKRTFASVVGKDDAGDAASSSSAKEEKNAQ